MEGFSEERAFTGRIETDIKRQGLGKALLGREQQKQGPRGWKGESSNEAGALRKRLVLEEVGERGGGEVRGWDLGF